MSLPSHIWRLYGTDPSSHTTVILGGVHGDELTGVEIVRQWLRSVLPDRNLLMEGPGEFEVPGITGQILIGLGNPEAILKGTRSSSTQQDLNRCFDRTLLDDPNQSWPDLERARELLPILEAADLLIDIHAVSKADSEPFICFGESSPTHEEICPLLPVKVILNDPDGKLGGPSGAMELPTTDQAVNRAGGTGICYETGYMKDMTKLPLAKLAIARVLQERGIISEDICTRWSPKPDAGLEEAQAALADLIEHGTTRLKLVTFQVNPWKDGDDGTQLVIADGMGIPWQPVQKGQLYATHPDGTQIHIPEDGFLVFPTDPKHLTNGKKTLFYIGQTY